MNENIHQTTSAGFPAGSRIPPHNNDAEQSVLGSILLKEDAFSTVQDMLSPSDFYREGHRIIFEAMLDLFQRSEPYDLVTVTNLLQSRNQLDTVGGAAYLASLTSIVPVASNLVSYARIINQKAILRNLIQLNGDIANRCFEEQDDVEQLVDDAEQAIFDLAGKKILLFLPRSRTLFPIVFKK